MFQTNLIMGLKAE